MNSQPPPPPPPGIVRRCMFAVMSQTLDPACGQQGLLNICTVNRSNGRIFYTHLCPSCRKKAEAGQMPSPHDEVTRRAFWDNVYWAGQ